MSSKLQHFQNLCQIFRTSVESVRPANLLSAANNYCLRPKQVGNCQNIQIQGKTFDVANKRCHVVGFGKAVLGLAVQLERALDEHLVDGFLSIPSGTLQQFQDNSDLQLSKQTRITVFEGAPNNQPDSMALQAAVRIKEFAATMTNDDILFVLISGGGSSLLPLPRATITLDEKMQLVRKLANCGASIDEMNQVRIALSDIKGGRLSVAARHANAVISFVISDIVGDPVDLIASGPTCATSAKRTTPSDVLRKYEMWSELPQHIQNLLQTPVSEVETKPGRNNLIYVVGDNRVATATALQKALKCGYNPFIASNAVQGDVKQLVRMYTNLLQNICDFRKQEINEETLRQRFPFDARIFQHFLKTLLLCDKTENPLLIILAGEPTVKVNGTGLGGRNQELALRMSLELYKNADFENITFLSAGTDGIDGPTPAAGALASHLVIQQYLTNEANSLQTLHNYINNNDSYNFYKNLNNGQYHVITGHTGTNVMDLQLLLVA